MKSEEIKSIDDLIASESFRKWILEKDESEAVYWNQWIEQNPAGIEWVAAARAIILSLTENVRGLSDNEINAEADLVQQKIRSSAKETYLNEEPAQSEDRHRGIGWGGKIAWAVAASLLMAIAGYLFFERNGDSMSSTNAYKQFLNETRNKSFEYNNSSDTSQRVLLSDGSEVVLEKDSKLSYAANFTSGKREVYLSGNAFFKIAHNPSKPFIVYTRDIVTKVLGTSFRVKALPNEKTVSVLVRTGKVSVFRRENFTSADAGSGTLKGVVLTPNQEMVYDVANAQMNKSLVEAPLPAHDSAVSFVFDDTRATDVFKKLHDAYGITILVDEETMASCTISATLGNESFYEKLNIICKIINATYQVIDGNVVVYSKGCFK